MSRTAAGPGRAPAALAVLLLILAGAGCRHQPAPEPAAPPQATGGADPASFRVLVFTRTAGFRHRSISDGVAAIRRLGRSHGFAVDDSADPVRIGQGLDGYQAVVFLSTTGELLNPDQQAALRRHLQGGGGWVGVHAAADAEYDWPWYGGLVGAWFRHHPPVQRATVRPAPGAAALAGKLPTRWQRTDEWYDFATNPRGRVRVLATVDESTYTGGRMGTDHPIAWCHEYDGGRAWYTAMGHTSESFHEPRFLAHLLAGISYAAGQTATRCDPSS
ncbi:MAG TPA: ThuA domain-containing protein [Actinomycetota bacterium]|nr:ThuA domain-containing protein [Actinomycetota bacterium]